MKRRILHIRTIFVFFLIVISVVFGVLISKQKITTDNGEVILELNEIEQLTKHSDISQESYDQIVGKIHELEDKMRKQTKEVKNSENVRLIVIFSVLCIIFLYSVFYYIYHSIIKPFEKMKQYSEQIANGNFDLPLDYERSNYFGKFTWAFDQMRCEIVKSRSCEKEAIENNKTVIE